MVVANIEPFGIPVLVRLYQLVRQVLVSRIFPHLNSSPSDYSRVIGTQLRLHSEKLPEQNPVGVDSHKRFTEVHENRNVEDAIGIKVQVLDAVVPEKTFEEVAGRKC
jgi:hypothetical protein